MDTNTTNIYNTTYTNITLSSLHPFYSYQCYVAAITVATGPFSDPVNVRTLQAGMTHSHMITMMKIPLSLLITRIQDKSITMM